MTAAAPLHLAHSCSVFIYSEIKVTFSACMGSAKSWPNLAYSSRHLEHGPERIYRPTVSSRSSHSVGSATMAFNHGGPDWSGGRDPEGLRVEALRAEFVELLERRTGSDGRHETAIPELK